MDALRWDLDAQQIQALTQQLMAQTKRVYDRVGAQSFDEVSYESTLKALADVEVTYTGEPGRGAGSGYEVRALGSVAAGAGGLEACGLRLSLTQSRVPSCHIPRTLGVCPRLPSRSRATSEADLPRGPCALSVPGGGRDPVPWRKTGAPALLTRWGRPGRSSRLSPHPPRPFQFRETSWTSPSTCPRPRTSARPARRPTSSCRSLTWR